MLQELLPDLGTDDRPFSMSAAGVSSVCDSPRFASFRRQEVRVLSCEYERDRFPTLNLQIILEYIQTKGMNVLQAACMDYDPAGSVRIFLQHIEQLERRGAIKIAY